MIKSITVTNHKDESITMILNNPYPSEFAIESIEGLEPEKANINSTENQVYDGASFDSAVVPIKPITINLKFLPKDGNIERVRHKCYNYFQTKKLVKLQIDTDERSTYIEGYVESNLPTIFSDSEGSAIALECMDPYFKDISDRSYPLVGTEGSFEFPFSNNDLINPILVMGTIWNEQSRLIYYYGDVETRMVIKITFSNDINWISVVNNSYDQQITINLNKVKSKYNNFTITDGDYLIIDTRYGKKTMKLYHSGIEYDAISGLDIDNLDWPGFFNGINLIEWNSSNNDHVKGFIVNNQVLYGGV